MKKKIKKLGKDTLAIKKLEMELNFEIIRRRRLMN